MMMMMMMDPDKMSARLMEQNETTHFLMRVCKP